MYRLHLYLTDDLKNKLALASRISGKTKAEVARDALEIGLKKTQSIKSNSAEALIKLAEMAEQLPTETKAPIDAVKNMDFYTWGGEKDE